MKIELKNYLYKNEAKYCLVGKIKGLAQENKKASLILKNKKYREGKGWIVARRIEALNASTRHHLLAYAYLTGKRYSKLEAKCREDNKPKAKTIYNIVREHLTEHYIKLYDISEDSVSKWLGN